MNYQERVTADVAALMAKATSLFNRQFPAYTIRFDIKGGTAGSVSFVRGWGGSIRDVVIRFNPALLEREGETMIQNTVPHEVAHLVAEVLYGEFGNKIGHGPKWKAVMRMFGVTPSRCHDYDVSDLKQKRTKFEVTCDCATHQLGATRYKRMFIDKTDTYSCKMCRAKLKAA